MRRRFETPSLLGLSVITALSACSPRTPDSPHQRLDLPREACTPSADDVAQDALRLAAAVNEADYTSHLRYLDENERPTGETLDLIGIVRPYGPGQDQGRSSRIVARLSHCTSADSVAAEPHVSPGKRQLLDTIRNIQDEK